MTGSAIITVDYRGNRRFGCDVTLAREIALALSGEGIEVTFLNINTPWGEWPEQGTVVVLADSFWAEGPNGTDSAPFGVRRALEAMGRDFLGSSAKAVARSSSGDKAACLDALRGEVPVPKHVLVSVRRSGAVAVACASIGFPMVVKVPCNSGCSQGVRFVPNAYALAALLDALNAPELLFEAFQPGREFTTWIIETDGSPSTLGTLELLRPAGRPILDAADKRAMSFGAPGQVRGGIGAGCRLAGAIDRAAVEPAALAAYRAAGLRDYARIDVILGEGPCVIDVNARAQLQVATIAPLAAARSLTYGAVLAGLVRQVALRRSSYAV